MKKSFFKKCATRGWMRCLTNQEVRDEAGAEYSRRSPFGDCLCQPFQKRDLRPSNYNRVGDGRSRISTTFHYAFLCHLNFVLRLTRRLAFSLASLLAEPI